MGTVVQPEKSFDRDVAVVDEVMEKTGDTATIFQRMNAAGRYVAGGDIT